MLSQDAHITTDWAENVFKILPGQPKKYFNCPNLSFKGPCTQLPSNGHIRCYPQRTTYAVTLKGPHTVILNNFVHSYPKPQITQWKFSLFSNPTRTWYCTESTERQSDEYSTHKTVTESTERQSDEYSTHKTVMESTECPSDEYSTRKTVMESTECQSDEYQGNKSPCTPPFLCSMYCP